MLRFVVTDTEGNTFSLPAPLSVCIRAEDDVPADDLYAVFPDEEVGELCRVAVYDGSRVVFRGVVDEQEHALSREGCFLRLSARSLAALLLDNEALPQCYDHPSAKLIYERHAQPYGIAAGDPDDATCFGELCVTKGMSQWGVLSAFCRVCYSTAPRVSADGVLYLREPPLSGDAVVFGGEGGIPYVSLTDTRRRCEEISRVNVKLKPDDGYGCRIENSDALSRGVVRERYLNAMLGSQSVRSADVMLRKSRRRARTLSLKCVGRHPDLLWREARIADRETGESFYVCAAEYRMNANGEYTAVKLRRR